MSQKKVENIFFFPCATVHVDDVHENGRGGVVGEDHPPFHLFFASFCWFGCQVLRMRSINPSFFTNSLSSLSHTHVTRHTHTFLSYSLSLSLSHTHTHTFSRYTHTLSLFTHSLSFILPYLISLNSKFLLLLRKKEQKRRLER